MLFFHIIIMKILKQEELDIIKTKVQAVLNERFVSGPKTKINPHRDRLNFACPYCGDSSDDIFKKRGNLYLNNLMYHCYNGGCSHPHSNFIEFVKDFNQSVSNLDNLNTFLDYMNNNKYDKYTISSIEEGEIFSKFKEYGISLQVIKEKYNLKPIEDCIKMHKYLRGRLLGHRLSNFMSNQDEDKLYIFNFLKDDTVIGWQIRDMNDRTDNKYKSYTIEKINEMVLDRKIEEENDIVMKMNTFSIYFGIIQADFSRDLTILEGPIDSMFINNSVATAGIDKSMDIFEDVESVRYLLDNDKVGIKAMEGLLKEKKRVFMWKKLLKDYSIKEKIKDVNDLVIYCWKNKCTALKELDNYFTSNPLDLLNV